jgi:hypothetical protein
MAGPNYPHWGDSYQIQEISVAPNFHTRLNNFVIFTAGLHFRDGFMFLCFLQFQYVILCSFSPVSDRYNLTLPLPHYRHLLFILDSIPFASYIGGAVYFRKSLFCPVDGDSSCLRNVGTLRPNCVTSHPRGQYS